MRKVLVAGYASRGSGIELGNALAGGLVAESDVEGGVAGGQGFEAAQAVGALGNVFGEAAGLDASARPTLPYARGPRPLATWC